LASGLLQSAANSARVSVFGVSPEAEKALSLIPQSVVDGTYLRDGNTSGLVIGRELARKLEVKVGSKMVLTTQGGPPSHPQNGRKDGGEIQSTLLRVTGIFRTGLRDFDAYVIHLPLAEAQELLGRPSQVTQVAIFLARESDTPLVAKRLQEKLGGIPAEVLTWQDSTTRLTQVFWLHDAFAYVSNGILLAMVGLGVLNTLLMGVLKRSYEFGVCAALGLRPRQLAGMVLCESLALTVISLTFGLLVGLTVHFSIAAYGLDLRWFTEINLPFWNVFDPILYSRLSLTRVVWSVVIVFAMAIVSSFYPAWKAARVTLSDAQRIF
jgi:ABC-type lipoprotein release transport system permease subunit